MTASTDSQIKSRVSPILQPLGNPFRQEAARRVSAIVLDP